MTKPAKALPPHTNVATCKTYKPSRARTRLGLWRALFLKALAESPSVTVACKVAGVPRMTAYDHRDRDPEFAEAWDNALAESLDVLEDAVYKRALTEDGDQLAMFLLRAHRPSLYRANVRHDLALLGGIVMIPSKADGAE